MREVNRYLDQRSWDTTGIQGLLPDAYEPPDIRKLGNAREVFLGGSSGSASDCFKAFKKDRKCS